ncbi:ASCH domain-containing protein [Nocardioides sp. JQ2195]|uniref:ASCH domain-containing protein n=1 Tax=Nocardioides sp. JQ2195 TaxID=2592334 RepID=UPI00143E6043|nr:ASCH domain-containing protein [Nocardioides sp. JQ2195]QIX26253.1 ASCH domain-containing protein [Nocardioides sp. JQ2195]
MSDEAIENFWANAKVRANLNRLRAYTGSNAQESLRPPAWAFGANADQADRLLALVLDGTKTATSSALRDYDSGQEPVPTVGTLSIITDGAGTPRALITTTDVRIVPFGDVDVEHARLEGEGDLSLEYWRDVHREFFTETGGEVTDDTEIVMERFKILWKP